MNMWAVVAVIAAFIFGLCIGVIATSLRERQYVKDLLKTCEDTSKKLSDLSKEYDDFVKSAQELDRWPKLNTHITSKEDLADYLKAKYLSENVEDGRYSWCSENNVDDRDPNCDFDDVDDDDEYDGYI